MHYLYRSTTDKLGEQLDSIVEAGDQVLSTHFVGGRDWVVICRRGPVANLDREVHEHIERLAEKASRRIDEASARIRQHVDRLAEKAEQAVLQRAVR